MSGKETKAILSGFKTQIIAFLDELIAQLPDEGDLVVMRLVLSTYMAPVDLMTQFLVHMNGNDQEMRHKARKRDDSFFLDHSMFEALDSHKRSKANHFKRIWRSGTLDETDKDIIWCWVDTFIAIGDRYEKAMRREQQRPERAVK